MIHKKIRKINIISVLFGTVLSVLSSCETTDKPENISGRYETIDGQEYFDFDASGFFTYDVRADAHPTGINTHPPFTGKYKVEKGGNIKLTPISVHLGLFQIHFSGDRDKLFIRHRYSGRNSVFEKVAP